MQTRGIVAVALVGLTVACAAAACSGRDDAEGRAFEVTGVVIGVDENGSVTVAHDDIAGLMPAMTMPFVPEELSAIDGLTSGDRVRFTLKVGADRSRISDVVVTGRSLVVDRSGTAAARPTARVRPGDPLPAFELVDQDGTAFIGDDLRGQRTIVTFIFTRCPLPEFCPRIMSRFRELQETIVADPSLSDVRLLGVTLDPGFDSPAVLEAYGRAAGANFERWTFLTGSTADVDVLTRAFAVQVQQTAVLPDHTLATALVDDQGRVVEIWRGNGWQTSDILETLRSPARF